MKRTPQEIEAAKEASRIKAVAAKQLRENTKAQIQGMRADIAAIRKSFPGLTFYQEGDLTIAAAPTSPHRDHHRPSMWLVATSWRNPNDAEHAVLGRWNAAMRLGADQSVLMRAHSPDHLFRILGCLAG